MMKYFDIFDSHAHYDDEQFENDLNALLSSFPEGGICGCITCATDTKNAKAAIELSEKYPFMYAAVGLHPLNIEDEESPDFIGFFRSLAENKKVVAIGESPVADFCHAAGDGERGEAAARESAIADFCHGLGDGDGGQSAAITESTIADECQGVGDGDVGQTNATHENLLADECQTVAEGDGGEADAILESTIVDECHAVGDGNGGQTTTHSESINAYGCHAVGDGNGGQSAAQSESIVVDGCHVVGSPFVDDGLGNDHFTRVFIYTNP